MRRVFSWKFVFYDLLLPALRMLGPTRGDAILGLLGRLVMAVRPGRPRQLRASLERVKLALDADWSVETTWPALAANTARFLARDYPLDRQPDEAVLRRFDVRGYERLSATLADGRGAILVGSHLGAHIAGVHWLFRRGVSVRLLVQRPRHVSSELNRRFDAGGCHPQA
jgi:phosphatidylinositol dimannoside acyltransferase